MSKDIQQLLRLVVLLFMILVIQTPRCANGEFNFSDIGDNLLSGGYGGSLAWGDYDNDGYPDIAMTGILDGPGTNLAAKIFHNNQNGTFTAIDDDYSQLTAVFRGALVWGDYDNDSYLDLFVTGDPVWSPMISRLLHNNGNGTFTALDVGIPATYDSAAAWADYDNDGDIDLLLTGAGSSSCMAKLYRNDGGAVFTERDLNLRGICYGSVAWGDYNNDGYSDILLTGYATSPNGAVSIVYRNNKDGTFSDVNADLPGVRDPSVVWGDYDNDGKLDFLLTGTTDPNGASSGAISRIYHNVGNDTFSEIDARLTGVLNGAVAWADFDNNGTLDILLAGASGSGLITKIYRNNGDGTFINSYNTDLPRMAVGEAGVADFDNDGDIDIAMLGYGTDLNIYFSRIFRNNLKHCVSGLITSNALPLPDVRVVMTGASSGDLWTDENGEYGFCGLNNGEYQITPQASLDLLFMPSERHVVVFGNSVVGQDFVAVTPTPTPQPTSTSVATPTPVVTVAPSPTPVNPASIQPKKATVKQKKGYMFFTMESITVLTANRYEIYLTPIKGKVRGKTKKIGSKTPVLRKKLSRGIYEVKYRVVFSSGFSGMSGKKVFTVK